MQLDLSVDEVLTTTRSVRKRLDLDRDVDRGVLMECLDIALQAPTGSNRQGWQWLFVDDLERKQALGDIYRRNFFEYRKQPGPSYASEDPRAERADKVIDSATYLAEHLHEVPVLLIPCIEGRPDSGVDGASAGLWGSLLPAVWSFMLALRERGLGSAWTTLHLVNGGERETADLLGIPGDQYTQGGLFPIAYTKGTDFKRAARLPASELTHWNHW